MDIRQLEALLAVAETGSFTLAADQLHTVQSNVSEHVRQLEAELGVQLLVRGPAGDGADRVRGPGDRAGPGRAQRARGAAQGPLDAAGSRDRARHPRRRRNGEPPARAHGRGRDAAQRAGAFAAPHRRCVRAPGRGGGRAAPRERGRDRARERPPPARRASARRSARRARAVGRATGRARADRPRRSRAGDVDPSAGREPVARRGRDRGARRSGSSCACRSRSKASGSSPTSSARAWACRSCPRPRSRAITSASGSCASRGCHRGGSRS